MQEIFASSARSYKALLLGTSLGICVSVAGLTIADSYDEKQKQNIYAQSEEAAKACANGEKGSLGEAIQLAGKIHVDLASIAPPVDQIFSKNCFGGLNRLLDLSVTIPSVGALLSAAQSFLMNMLNEKVCNAVEKASNMIAEPINQGLDKISNYTNGGDFAGLLNQQIGHGLGRISPEIGQGFMSQAPAGQTLDFQMGNALTQAYERQKSEGMQGSMPSNGSYAASFNQQMQQINQAQKTVLGNYKDTIQLNPQLNAARQQYAYCMNQGGNCEQQQNMVNKIQNELTQKEQQNQQLTQNHFSTQMNTAKPTQNNPNNEGFIGTQN